MIFPSVHSNVDTKIVYPKEWKIDVYEVYNSIWFLSLAVTQFHDRLYHQKHAFYFREIRQWDECLSVSFF